MRFYLIVMVFLVSACNEVGYVKVEPTHKRTFSMISPIFSGDEIRIVVNKLGETERLQFHLCGPECRTAEQISTCTARELEDEEVVFTAPVDGDYYFWINDTGEAGAKTAVEVSKERTADEGHTLLFSSGSSITVYPVERLTR